MIFNQDRDGAEGAPPRPTATTPGQAPHDTDKNKTMNDSNVTSPVRVSTDAEAFSSPPPPYAAVAPDMHEKGYRPVPIHRGEKRPIPMGWNEADEDEVAGWTELHSDAQTGLRTGAGLLAFDSDIDDPELADIVKKAIEEVVGELPPTRYRDNSERTTYLFRREGEHSKQTVALERLDRETGEVHRQAIELLADGQQVVVSGLHPSGVRVKWRNGSPKSVPREELPELGGEMLVRLLTLIVERAEAARWTFAGSSARGSASTTLSESDVPAFSLETHSADDVRHLLEAQDPAAEYPEWFATIAAVANWHGGEAGLTIALDWSDCKRWPSAEHGDRVRKVFASVAQGRYTGRRRTLASLMRDRKRFDERQRAQPVSASENEAVRKHQERCEAPGEVGDWREILEAIRADEQLTDKGRHMLCEPLRQRIKRGKLTPPSAKDMRDMLTVEESSPRIEVERVDPVGRAIRDLDARAFYYCDTEGNPFAELCEEGGRRVAISTEGRALDDQLVLDGATRYGRRMTKPEREAVRDHASASARRSGNVRATRKRYALETDAGGNPARVFEDLCDGEGTVLAIAADGVREADPVEDRPFRFVPGRDAIASGEHAAVSREELADRVWELLGAMNVPAGMAVPLLGAIVAARMGFEHCPILIATGGHGSGKSTLVEQYQQLVDPQSVAQVAPSHDQRSLRRRLGANYLTAEHNAERYNARMQNDLCVAADGGAVDEAKLYANAEKVTTHVGGPVALSAIDPTVLDQEDVRSRALTLRVTPPAMEVGPEVLRARFAAALPAYHATLRGLASEVLALWSEVEDQRGHRYGVFARVSNCVARVLGEMRPFVELMAGAREDERTDAFEGSLFAQDVVRFMAAGEHRKGWSGTGSELLEALTMLHGIQPEARRRERDPDYPQNGSRVGRALDELLPVLAQAGVEFERKRKKGDRLLRLRLNGDAPAAGAFRSRYSWTDIVDEFDDISATAA